MEKLSHRERVLLTLSHQEADRVPIDFLGHASMMLDQAYFRLLEHLNLDRNVESYRFRTGSTANYYDTRLLELFDIDFRRLFLPVRPGGMFQYHNDGTFTDSWGILWEKTGIYIISKRGPLEGMNIDEVANYNWPEPARIWDINDLADYAKQLNLNSDFALVARNPLTYGFLDRACRLRGMEQFLLDLLLNPELAQMIVNGILSVHLKVYDMFLQAIGPYVHIVETGDDLGSQENLLISPKMYRKFIKPAQKRLHTLIKDRAPQANIFMHNDGSISKIIPDLIEVGVDILNPVQPSAASMESEILKRDFGNQLTFHGGVDQKPLEGTEDNIRTEVRHRINAFAPGGGYILSTCNHIINAPSQNVVTLFYEAREYGQYPIDRSFQR